jgi:hypothetical protein
MTKKKLPKNGTELCSIFVGKLDKKCAIITVEICATVFSAYGKEEHHV